MTAVLTIAGTSVRRLLRDRSNLFFVFVFPLLLVLLIGATFAGQQNLRLAVYANDVGPLGDQLVSALDARDGLRVDRYDTAAAAADAASRDQADGALLLPAGYDDALRQGRQVEVRYVATPGTTGPALQSLVQAEVADQAMVLAAADVVAATSNLAFPDALDVAEATVGLSSGVTVSVQQVGTSELAQAFQGLGQFDLSASQELLLFVFLTSLTGGAALIQSREYGVTTRMLASPVTTNRIILGEALGRFLVAMVQGIYIIVGTMLIFRVDWGSLVASLTVLAAYAVPCAAAGLLVGAAMKNQNQAAAVGIGLGIGLAALGGSMAPLEVLPETMRRIAHVTPHAWGYDAFAKIVRHGGSVLDVLPQLAVLLGMGAVILALAAIALRRTLTRI
jgi:ABC-2 type transport system permease protein